MDRRKFIKSSLCLGAAMAAGGCIYGANCFYNSSHPENKFKIKPSQLPKTVRLEACNNCQLNCARCWIREDEQEIIKNAGGFGYLKFDDFKNFVDKHPFIEEIELSNNGEIFLNPELDEIIEYADAHHVGLTAFNGVNLNTLSEKTAEALVKYNFNGLTVSIDGATPEVYQIYRRGGDFNRVISNIKMINKFKEQYNSESPHMVYQFIVFGHNEHEIDAAKALAEKLNMEMVFIANIVEGYSPLKNPEMVREKTGLNSLGTDAVDTFENQNWNDVYCSQLVNSPQINFNGDLMGCCCIATKTFKVNVFEKGLLNALNSKNVLNAKRMLSDFSVPQFENIPCYNCDVYLSLKRVNKPLVF